MLPSGRSPLREKGVSGEISRVYLLFFPAYGGKYSLQSLEPHICCRVGKLCVVTYILKIGCVCVCV